METILTKKLFILLFCLATVQSVLFSAEKEPSSDLRKAIHNDNVDEVREIIVSSSGAVVNKPFWFGQIPLVFAAGVNNMNSLEVVQLLIENQANINGQETVENETALYRATINNCLDVVRLLIKYNANVKIRSKFGHTALTIAELHLQVYGATGRGDIDKEVRVKKIITLLKTPPIVDSEK